MGLFISKAWIPPDDILGCVASTVGLVEGEEPVVECLPPFSEPDWYWGLAQVLTLMTLYGYILFYASNLLSSGSELLLLVPSLAGIVGSVVLPILGAVPDGAITLFSGIGPNAQENISVGMGTLAGSTIMLLTIPWGLSIFLGKVPIGPNGEGNYKNKKRGSIQLMTDDWFPAMLTMMGVTPEPSIQSGAKIMVLTSLTYLVIQGPAFGYATDSSTSAMDQIRTADHSFALAGLVLALLGFVFYLYLMVNGETATDQNYLINAAAVRAIAASSGAAAAVTLAGVIAPIVASAANMASEGTNVTFLSGEGKNRLLDDKGKKQLDNLLKPFFKKYDQNSDGKINASELRELLRDLREDASLEEAEEWMQTLDPAKEGVIRTDEFTDAMLNFVQVKARRELRGGFTSDGKRCGPPAKKENLKMPVTAGMQAEGIFRFSAAAEAEGEDDEEEEMPEDLEDLSPEEQQRLIKRRAFSMMALGLTLILFFSDPMVDVMSNVGARTGVPPFYVSFVLAPLASNASELIASLSYAAKKTRKTVTVSLSALEGAAAMNNTFGLAIVLALVYFQNLAYKYSAETLAILLVEVAVALIALQKTQYVWHGAIALALFPLSIVFIATLEAYGID